MVVIQTEAVKRQNYTAMGRGVARATVAAARMAATRILRLGYVEI